jgi:HEAT repeat protein
VIVAVIIVVWALFNWLAHADVDPRDYVQALRRDTPNRWQQAHNLSIELNKSGNEELKRNVEFAKELVDLLDNQLDAAAMDENSVTLRYYLCVVLGEFQVPEVLPVLIKAVRTNRDERESAVPLAGIHGLARLVPNLGSEKLRGDTALRDVLLTASENSDRIYRYYAAFALGVLGGDAALGRLRVLLDDADVDVRMNAATGLARHGDSAAVPTLVAMLDAADAEAAGTKAEPAQRAAKQLTVRLNALEAAMQLARANPQVDRKPLADAVERLIARDLPAGVRAKAAEARLVLAP